jgi:Tfp pilus assembly protein PilN
MLGVAAAVFIIIGAAAQLWDLRRELAVVQARRAEIREAVSGATEARGSIELLQRRLAALEPIESRATRWSAVLAEVASHLPRDAYLVSIRGAADTLTVEGLASSAAGVFERLERAPGIISVQPAGSIRRDVDDAGVTLERFTIAARLGRDTAAVAPKGRR